MTKQRNVLNVWKCFKAPIHANVKVSQVQVVTFRMNAEKFNKFK